MPAKSRGRVHAIFQDRVEELAEQATTIADATRQTEQRVWQYPDELETGPLDIPGITEAFDRTEIATNYEEAVSDGASPGTVGDVISLKNQGDYVAVMERAFRARHATPVRNLAHAAARRKGQGHEKGIFKGGVLVHAQDTLKAGSEGGT